MNQPHTLRPHLICGESVVVNDVSSIRGFTVEFVNLRRKNIDRSHKDFLSVEVVRSIFRASNSQRRNVLGADMNHVIATLQNTINEPKIF